MRSREDKVVGTMRIDEIAHFFEALLPKKSNSFEQLYSKVWKPEDFPVVEAQPEEPK